MAATCASFSAILARSAVHQALSAANCQGAASKRLVHLRHHRLRITDQGHFGRHIGAYLFGGDIKLHHAHVARETRRQSEMHDPVQARADEEYDVGLLQCQRTRRRHRLRMVVRHHALAHRRGQERQARGFNEGTHLLFGARIGRALADDHQRPFGGAQRGQRALHFARVGQRLRRRRTARRPRHRCPHRACRR